MYIHMYMNMCMFMNMYMSMSMSLSPRADVPQLRPLLWRLLLTLRVTGLVPIQVFHSGKVMAPHALAKRMVAKPRAARRARRASQPCRWQC